MKKEKIYVHVIDGTDLWIPISAKKVKESRYEILKDKEFDEMDTGTLMEFIPGDIVELGQHRFKNGKKELVAKKLITPSSRTDKQYFEFQFDCVQKRIEVSIDVQNKYERVIERIEGEMNDGQFFYPHVKEKIEELKKIKR